MGSSIHETNSFFGKPTQLYENGDITLSKYQDIEVGFFDNHASYVQIDFEVNRKPIGVNAFDISSWPITARSINLKWIL